MKTAVIIDDNPEVGAQLRGMLMRIDLKVVAVCEDGRLGLAAICVHHPDLAIIDKQLAGMDGIDIVRAVRAKGIKTKLVMCSGSAQGAVKDEAFAAGVDDFIVKPFDQILHRRQLKALLET